MWWTCAPDGALGNDETGKARSGVRRLHRDQSCVDVTGEAVASEMLVVQYVYV